jgi:hypothetical protein
MFSADSNSSGHSGPSWGLTLSLLIAAILVAALIAYRMIYPFFHTHPH